MEKTIQHFDPNISNSSFGFLREDNKNRDILQYYLVLQFQA